MVRMALWRHLGWLGFGIIPSVLLVNGCAGVPIIHFARTGEFGVFNPLVLIIGLGIMWYSWVEAKRKNRNPLAWLTLAFFFGFIPFFVLVYLKDLPAENKAGNTP